MRYKKIMMLTIILAFLLAVSAVSAVENATDYIVSADINEDVVSVEETTDEVVSVENNQVITEGNASVGSFADLETEINNVEEGGVLNLTKDYKYVNGSTEGISINKHIIIEGNNYVIDGNFQSRIFTIYSDGVTLKNLKIVGGVNWIGGAIYSSGQNLNVINCTFENNIAKETTGGDGGAIYISGKNSYVINCTFVNCSAECGGAILWSADYGNLINSRFYKCFVFRDKGDCEKQGAALRWEGNSAKIFNCSFINNFITGSVIASGGGIYIRNSDNSIISNCSFINNTCGVAAGMNIEYCNHVSISNSIFKNNFNSRDGGCTIFSYEWTNGLMFNCSFVNNSDVNNIGLLSSSVIINNSFFDPDSDIIVYENIVLIKKVSKLSHGDCIFVYGDSKAFWVLLRTEDNIILINKTIIFKFMEFDYQFKVNTNNEGIAEIDELNDLAVGIWNVSVIFEGTGNYAPCNATATITVLPATSSLTIDDVNATWDQETNFTAKVMSDNKTVDEGTVSFYIDDKFIGDASVVNGTATLTHEAPGDAGNHILSAIYNGSNYLRSNGTAKMFVDTGDVEVEDYDSIATFNALANLIENAPEGSVLNLTKDYIYVSGSTEGISINKAITIDGKGHVLDGNKLSRIFYVSANDVSFKNIKFFNGNHNTGGGAIAGDISFIDNCTFSNNSARTGGAIWGSFDSINNSIFISNSAPKDSGGAIWGSFDSINNCTFIDCTSRGFGGAIYCFGGNPKSFILSNCTFINNTLINPISGFDVGGSICCDADNIILERCKIIYNFEFWHGAPVYWRGDNGIINDTYFYPTSNSVLLCDGYNLNFIKHEANIKCDNYSFRYLEKTNFTGRLTSDKTPLSNEKVIIIISNNYLNHIFETVSDEKGIILLNNELNNLSVGTWNVTVLFEGNDNYAPCNATATITVLPPSTSLSIDDVNATVGHEITLVANVNSTLTVNEGVVVFFDGETQIGDSPVSNGTATLIYVPTSAGEHNITAIFNSSNYLSSNDTAKLLVEYSAIEILVDNGVVDYNMDITVKISNPENLTVNNGIVVFFDGETQIGESAVSNGFATITYVPTTAGEHNVTAKYKLDNSEDSTNSILFNVSKAEIDLNICYIDTVYFSNPSNFAVNVLSNSKRVNEGNIKYYVNGNYIGMSNVYDGKSSTSYTTNTTGSFELLAIYNETDNYLARNVSTTFYVNQMPTTLTGESVIFDEQQYKTFTTELKDNNANGVYNQTVRIELIKYSGESATFTGVSDGNGITFYDVGTLAGGMWYVAGTYNGNENYIGSNFADKFIVVRLDTTTEIEEIQNAQVNHNYKLKANIHDENGKLVKEGILQFYLDGVDIGSIDLSNNQGHQSALGNGVLGAVNPMFEYELGADDSDLYLNYVPTKAGKHTLTAVYEGTTIYKASNQTTTFIVKDGAMPTVITASGVTTVYNGGQKIVILLKDAYGNKLDGVKVTVKFSNGAKVTADVVNGKAKVSTNGLKPVNKYTAKITFNGNDNYEKSTAKVTVKVFKATPKITAKAQKFKRSDKKKQYTIRLLTNQNIKMKYAKVYIKVNGKVYAAQTNKKGYATFSLKKLTKKGTYKAKIMYGGNSYYNALTTKVKLTVK